MLIQRVLRKRASTARVVLDSGLSVKIPAVMAVVGADIPDNDIVSFETNGILDYYHSSIVPRPKPKKEFEIYLVTEEEAKVYLDFIRNAVRKHIHLIRKHYDQDYFDETVSKVFLHLYERGYFKNFNKDSKIQGYVSVCTKRLFIDWNRTSSFNVNDRAFSMNNNLSEDGDTFIDFLPDERINVEDLIMQQALLDTLINYSIGYSDGEIIPGIPTLSVIRHLMSGKKVEEYPVDKKVLPRLKSNLSLFVSDFKDYLRAM